MPRLDGGDPERSLRLFLIDDHPLFREGLREVLEEEIGAEVVGESGAGSGSIEQVVASGADIVLIDRSLPDVDGIDLCSSIIELTEARCIILTSFEPSEFDVARAATAGASAYVVKGCALNDLLAAIGSVAAAPDYERTIDLVREYREVGTEGSIV